MNWLEKRGTVLLMGGFLVLAGLVFWWLKGPKTLPAPATEETMAESDGIKKPARINYVKKNETGLEHQEPLSTEPAQLHKTPEQGHADTNDANKDKSLLEHQEPMVSGSSPWPGTQENEPIKGESERIKELIESIKSTNWRIQSKAAELLVKIGEPAVSELTEALLAEDISPPVKAKLISALGKIGDVRAVPLLVEALSDENAYTRRCAAEGLGRVQDSDALDPLIKALSDPDVSVRERAASALGKLNDEKSVAPLIEKLSDESYRVRTSAIRTLATIGDKKAVEPIQKQLGVKHDQLYKNKLVWALGELGDPQVIPVLQDYLKELEGRRPRGKMAIFPWKRAVQIAKEAISKLQH